MDRNSERIQGSGGNVPYRSSKSHKNRNPQDKSNTDNAVSYPIGPNSYSERREEFESSGYSERSKNDAPVYVTGYCKKDKELLPENGPFFYKGLTRWMTYTDGSCLLHAIFNAFWKPYRLGRFEGKSFDRLLFVRNFRTQMAKALSQPSDEKDPTSPANYELLSNGSLKELSSYIPECNLENMKKVLDSEEFLGQVFIEYFSNQLSLDIYIIDLKKMDVYMTGRSDDNLYFKSRNSVVIGYIDKHFETLSVKTSPENYDTYFSSEAPFIRAIWKRKR